MRPFELADRWGADRRATLGVFLQATVGGLLDHDLGRPLPGLPGREVARSRRSGISARRPTASPATSSSTPSFDQLVEVRFSPSPARAEVESREFCIGGPMNTPHVVAQLPLGARRAPDGDRARLRRAVPGCGRRGRVTAGLDVSAWLAAARSRR